MFWYLKRIFSLTVRDVALSSYSTHTVYGAVFRSTVLAEGSTCSQWRLFVVICFKLTDLRHFQHVKNHRRRNNDLRSISIPTIANCTTLHSPFCITFLITLSLRCYLQYGLQIYSALRQFSVLRLQSPHFFSFSTPPSRSPYCTSLQNFNLSNIFCTL